MKKDVKVALVFLVAGMSSRFNGEVKQFARVGPKGETLIEYSLGQALKKNKFNKIVFIVGDKTEEGFKEMFGEVYMGIPVFYARQDFDSKARDRPWGTVDALCCAKGVVDSSFIICNGDDLYGENSFDILYKHLQKNRVSATVGYKLGGVLSDRCSVNRGIFEIDENEYVEDLEEYFGLEESNIEKKGLSVDSLCSMNIFAFPSDVLDRFDAQLESFKGRNEGDRCAECLLSTEISELLKKDLMKIKVYTATDVWTGVTSPECVKDVRKVILSQLA